jgi:dTDP-glucose pyrophosphorylase
MNKDLALIVPAAGRGSRFVKQGILEPKPLVDLRGRPFFWWATESVRRSVNLRQIIYVVLEEHVKSFSIDSRIKNFYPDATIVVIPDITSGAAETAKTGLNALASDGPVAINDCDHAFICGAIGKTVLQLNGHLDAALMCFQSKNPAYSYVKLNNDGKIIGTVEKKVISPYAIAGCYFFSSSTNYFQCYEQYKKECPYNELFISGIFNVLANNTSNINLLELDRHVSFGTPEEKNEISEARFTPFLGWN